MLLPYCMFAFRCDGRRVVVCALHLLQVQLYDRCSINLALIGGRTTSCFRWYNSKTVSALNSVPHCLQYLGTCFWISSGFSPIFSEPPLCPIWPPLFLLPFSRKLYLLTLPKSCELGVELVSLLRPFLSNWISICKSFIKDSASDNCCFSPAFSRLRLSYSIRDMVIVSSILLRNNYI